MEENPPRFGGEKHYNAVGKDTHAITLVKAIIRYCLPNLEISIAVHWIFQDVA